MAGTAVAAPHPEHSSSMKLTFLILFVAILTGCGADTQADSETHKDPGMFGKQPEQTYVISSPLHGVLIQDGKPLANTKIIRQLWWNGNEEGLLQEFHTDEQGRFYLPLHEEQLSLGKLTQFACSAYIAAEVNGQRIDLWYNDKYEKQLYAETDGHQIDDLKCDLSYEEIAVKAGISRISTKCRWTNMPEESEF